MKRFLSLLLPGAMILALLVPFAMAGGTSAASPEEEASQPTAREVTLTAQKATTQNASKAPNQSSYVNFEDLRKLLNKYNKNVKALKSAISEADDMIPSTGTALIQSAIATYDAALLNISFNPSPATSEDFINNALYLSFTSSRESLNSQKQQLQQGNATVETTQNSLNDSINQIVKGTETLYIAIITMEASVKDIQRGIEALDRAVALVEKQHELGMASAYDVESIRHQRASVQSQLESLQYQIKTSKMTLEGMLGMEINGTVTLNSLPMPTKEDLEKIDYDKQRTTAMRRNVDVMNADVKDSYSSSSSTSYSYDAAVDTFTYKFKLVCLNVPEQQRLVDAAQETLDFQKRTFEIAAKKYELGMLSHEEYLSAESEVKSAESSLFSAKLNLFTAYRNYIYAYQYGIV